VETKCRMERWRSGPCSRCWPAWHWDGLSSVWSFRERERERERCYYLRGSLLNRSIKRRDSSKLFLNSLEKNCVDLLWTLGFTSMLLLFFGRGRLWGETWLLCSFLFYLLLSLLDYFCITIGELRASFFYFFHFLFLLSAFLFILFKFY